MERNYDEVISEMLLQLDQIDRRMGKADKGMDLTIRRLVKVEDRLERAKNEWAFLIKNWSNRSKIKENFSKHSLRLTSTSSTLSRRIQ